MITFKVRVPWFGISLRDGINSQRRRERRFSGFETGQLGKISVFLNNFFSAVGWFRNSKVFST